jgi:hypothetical protein
MDETEMFDYRGRRGEALDDLWVKACNECGALIHGEDEDRHKEWHARTTVHVGTDQGAYERGTSVERANRPKPWEE